MDTEPKKENHGSKFLVNWLNYSIQIKNRMIPSRGSIDAISFENFNWKFRNVGVQMFVSCLRTEDYFGCVTHIYWMMPIWNGIIGNQTMNQQMNGWRKNQHTNEASERTSARAHACTHTRTLIVLVNLNCKIGILNMNFDYVLAHSMSVCHSISEYHT